jgi:hypothetical protein
VGRDRPEKRWPDGSPGTATLNKQKNTTEGEIPMKLKMLAASLLLAAGSVQAAPVTLFLDNITFTTNNTPGQEFYVGVGTTVAGYINGFCPSCGDFTVGTLTGQGGGTLSSAVIDGPNVQLKDVRWIINNVFGQNYDLSFDAALTVIGQGVAMVKSNVTCVRYSGPGAGTTCPDATSVANPLGPIKSGFGFNVDFTGQSAIGTACVSTNPLNNPQCAVNVTLNPAQTKLTVEIRKALSETSQGFQSFKLNYVVPVPAAAWLMLSAVGGLAAFRRRVAA